MAPFVIAVVRRFMFQNTVLGNFLQSSFPQNLLFLAITRSQFSNILLKTKFNNLLVIQYSYFKGAFSTTKLNKVLLMSINLTIE